MPCNISFQDCRHTAALFFHLIDDDTNGEIYESTQNMEIASWPGATSNGASAQNLTTKPGGLFA